MKGITLTLLCAIALTTAANIRQESGCSIETSIHSLVEHENCNQYYQCVFGELKALTCPNNLLYNPQFQVCDWAQNVNCGDRLLPELIESENEGSEDQAVNAPHAMCAEQGLSDNLIEHDTCNKFYMCTDGLPIVITCPGDLMYNPELKICDWRQNVDCKNKHVPHEEALTASVNTLNIVLSSDDLVNEENEVEEEEDAPNDETLAICAADSSEGIFVEHERCDKFYICTGGLPVSQPCPDGLLFNEELHVCDWRVNVECGDRVL